MLDRAGAGGRGWPMGVELRSGALGSTSETAILDARAVTKSPVTILEHPEERREQKGQKIRKGRTGGEKQGPKLEFPRLH